MSTLTAFVLRWKSRAQNGWREILEEALPLHFFSKVSGRRAIHLFVSHAQFAPDP